SLRDGELRRVTIHADGEAAREGALGEEPVATADVEHGIDEGKRGDPARLDGTLEGERHRGGSEVTLEVVHGRSMRTSSGPTTAQSSVASRSRHQPRPR